MEASASIFTSTKHSFSLTTVLPAPKIQQLYRHHHTPQILQKIQSFGSDKRIYNQF